MAIDWFTIAKQHAFETPFEMLESFYVDEGLTIAQLAEYFKVSTWAVTNALHRFNVPIRPQGGRRAKKGA